MSEIRLYENIDAGSRKDPEPEYFQSYVVADPAGVGNPFVLRDPAAQTDAYQSQYITWDTVNNWIEIAASGLYHIVADITMEDAGGTDSLAFELYDVNAIAVLATAIAFGDGANGARVHLEYDLVVTDAYITANTSYDLQFLELRQDTNSTTVADSQITVKRLNLIAKIV